MRTRLLTPAALVIALAGWAAADESPARVAGLIAKLGSPRYAEREAASRALDGLGEAALEPLRAAFKSEDAEVRHRAALLADGIEQRLANARLLAPGFVTLDFTATPLPEAVAALKRQTGLDIQVSDAVGRRAVTVVSKPLPAWEALELFCRRADLREWDGYTVAPRGFPSAAQSQFQQ